MFFLLYHLYHSGATWTFQIHSRYVKFELYNDEFTSRNKLNYEIDSTGTVLSIERLSVNKNTLDELFNIINLFNPEWMYIQPSVLQFIMLNLKDAHIKILNNLKYIEVCGEVFTKELRNMTQNMLLVPIANMYGSEEMNGIAIECPNHVMHIISNNVLVEVADDSDNVYSWGEGRAIITNLSNYAMPFIRYYQGDMISLKEKHMCKCGYNDQIIELINGRVREQFIINNIRVDSSFLSDCIYKISVYLKIKIKYYHFTFYKSKQILQCDIYIENKRVSISVEDVVNKIMKVFCNHKITDVNIKCNIFLEDQYLFTKQKYRVLDIIEE